MKGAIVLAVVGLLLVLCGVPLMRSDALHHPDDGRWLLGIVLGFVGVVLIFIAAARAAH